MLVCGGAVEGLVLFWRFSWRAQGLAFCLEGQFVLAWRKGQSARLAQAPDVRAAPSTPLRERQARAGVLSEVGVGS